jgi:hypothetical protein
VSKEGVAVNNLFDGLLRKATIPDRNASLEKTQIKKLVLKVGDRLVHNMSQVHGRLEAIEFVGGRETLTVRTNANTLLRGLSRFEFSLCAGEKAYVTPAAKTPEVAQEPIESGLKGQISGESLLDEITR